MENYKHHGYLSFRKKTNSTVVQNVPLIDLGTSAQTCHLFV